MRGEHRVATRRHPDHDAGLDALVVAAAGGDRAALGRLLETLRPLVVRLCRARLRGDRRTDAEDVAQEALLAVLRSLPRYREQGLPFLAWVHGIVTHKVIDALRSAGRHPALVEEVDGGTEPGPGPEDLALRREAADRLRSVLDTLPARQREILALRVGVGLSAAETAEAVGSTPGAVRVAQHRALTALRARARDLLPEEPALLHEDLTSDFVTAPCTGDPTLDALLADADAALGELGGRGADLSPGSQTTG